MSMIVGVRFSDVGKLYYYDPGPLELDCGDCVLVETARGVEFGEVVLGPREVEDTEITSSLKKVMKRADDRDFRKLEQNVRREEEAFRVGEERIEKRELGMKLIDVEHTFDGSKLIFYFTAEGRVDFRELVKDLAAVFRTRIEMRQIGVRDAAKKIGGIGICGRPICCNAFLDNFAPVSVKTAKAQHISLSPTKISGLCGRLMCCIHYEHEHYKEMNRKLPRIGATVETPDGPAEVVETDPLCERIKGRIVLPDGTAEVRKYSLEELLSTGRRPSHSDRRQDRADDYEDDAEEAEFSEKIEKPEHQVVKPRKRRAQHASHPAHAAHAQAAQKAHPKEQKYDQYIPQNASHKRSDKRRPAKRPKEAKNDTRV